jgi:hypothetical protein
MRASTQACSEVSSAAPRPLRCARDPRTRTAALHKVPLSLGRICSSGWHPLVARPTAGLLSFTRRLPRIPCSLRGLEHAGRVHAQSGTRSPGRRRRRGQGRAQRPSSQGECGPVDKRDVTTRNLAALAGEDRAALSGRPRKANAGQYEIVLHHCHHESAMQQPAVTSSQTRNSAEPAAPHTASCRWHPPA